MARFETKSRRKRNSNRNSNGHATPVTKLTPEQPAARDEGPRLIPFPATQQRYGLDPPRVQHYLDLAEKALENTAAVDGAPGSNKK